MFQKSLPELENAITNMYFSMLVYKSKAERENKLDKKIASWIVHCLSENNNKGRRDNPTSIAKNKFTLRIMEDLENLRKVPTPSQAM